MLADKHHVPGLRRDGLYNRHKLSGRIVRRKLSSRRRSSFCGGISRNEYAGAHEIS